MKEYSESAKRTSAILSIMLSYFLVIINYRISSLLLEQIIKNVRVWIFISFGGAFLCIIVPVLVAWHIYRFDIMYLLWGLPTIFILVLLYSPPGFYFIIPKGGIAAPEPKSDNWKYGIVIAIMFLIIQAFAIGVAKGITETNQEDMLSCDQDKNGS